MLYLFVNFSYSYLLWIFLNIVEGLSYFLHDCLLKWSVLWLSEFRCTSWSPHDKFGHARDKSFQHPIKLYFGMAMHINFVFVFIFIVIFPVMNLMFLACSIDISLTLKVLISWVAIKVQNLAAVGRLRNFVFTKTGC